jgi:uncharacterized HAD superfamily protein
MRNHKAVCYDLDSTMFDVFHREHLAPEGALRADVDNWIDYSKACVGDTPVAGVMKSAKMFKKAGYNIFFVSGRNFEAYDETIAVIEANDIPWDSIRLHKSDDLRHNGEYKVQAIRDYIELGYEIELFFEDHVSVCEMIERETGVPCISVNPRYNDGVGVSLNLNQYPASELVASSAR